MMKHKSVFFIAVAMMLAPGINGALGISLIEPSASRVKCVSLTSSTVCTGLAATDYSRDWNGICGGAMVSGIAACGYIDSLEGPAIGSLQTKVDFVHNPEDLYHVECWCRMTIPALSPWVYAGRVTNDLSEDSCNMGCAQLCAESLTNTSFKAGLFGNMS